MFLGCKTMIIYVDENKIPITDTGVEPDWSCWKSYGVEEVPLENGEFDVLMFCRKFTDYELYRKAENDHRQRIYEQTPIALGMFVMQADFPDEQALQVEAFYPEWKVGEKYKISDIRRYKDELYRCLLDNTAAAEHTPDIAIGLWKKILPAEEPGGYLPWVQPVGATDAYKKGDRVTHKDKTWESTVDNNVWEPGVYGWIEVQE